MPKTLVGYHRFAVIAEALLVEQAKTLANKLRHAPGFGVIGDAMVAESEQALVLKG